ncbi:MAG TPA: sugar ABC transporter permease [Anaerolineales bacterium]|nr:sugar ABC transporter permease [Anaerolineales bacterium]
MEQARRLPLQKKPPQWLRNSLPFWLILPTAIVLFAIQVYPFLYTIWLSLEQRKPTGWVFVGLKNFTQLFATTLFGESAGLTVVFLVLFVALTLGTGFLIAYLLSRNISFTGLYTTLLFIPWVLSDIISGEVFRLLVLPSYGVLSGYLQNPKIFPPHGLSVLTAPPPNPWIGSFPFPPSPALVLLILATTWRALPFITLLLLASIQMIPKEVIESARIDGANSLQAIWYIMLPIMRPTVVVAIFSLTLSGMNGVGMIFSLTGGGPGTETEIMPWLLYSIGWLQVNFNWAAALALLIGVINLLLIIGTLRATRLEEANG